MEATMNIEDLSNRTQAKLRELYSLGLTKSEWESQQLIQAVCRQLSIDAKELGRRIAARRVGVYAI